MGLREMNMTPIAKDTARVVASAIEEILQAKFSPGEKQARIEKIIRDTSNHFSQKTYADASQIFANSISADDLIDDFQISRLAQKTTRDYALMRDNLAADINTFFDSILADAQSEAFANAKSLEKHPILTRSIVSETCAWCQSKARTFADPKPEDFSRHRKCDCLFVVSGYNSRNGVLKNYRKTN